MPVVVLLTKYATLMLTTNELKVQRILIEMDEANVRAGPLTLSALLVAKKLEGDTQSAKDFFETIRTHKYPIKAQDLKYDVHLQVFSPVFSTMLSIYLSEGNVAGVLDIVKEYRKYSLRPEEWPFIDIIKVHLLVWNPSSQFSFFGPTFT